MRLTIPGLLAVLVPALGGTAMADDLPNLSAQDILTQFDAVTTGNFSEGASVGGRIAVGGSLSGSFSTFQASGLAASSYGAVNVYGDVNGGNYNVGNKGSVFLSTKSANTGTFPGASSTTSLLNPSSFSSAFGSSLTTLSTQLGGMKTNNVATTQGGGISFDANTATHGYVIFTLSSSDLSKYNNIDITNKSGASSIIIDVTGSDSYTQNANFDLDSSLASHVIWNFQNASTVNLGNFNGTVLA